MADVIWVDDREGSGDLVPLLQARGLKAQATRLEVGDVSMLGNGPAGRPVPIGVEIKAVGDLLRCIADGRFMDGQLPGLMNTYEVIYLLVEGGMRPDATTGDLLLPYGGGWAPVPWGQRVWKWKAVQAWLIEQEIFGGLRVVRTWDRRETVQWLHVLYAWWVLREWDEHHARETWYVPNAQLRDETKLDLLAPPLCARVAALLPGVGAKRARAVAKAFGTIAEMAKAEEGEWSKVEYISDKGKLLRIGAAIARKAWAAVHLQR